MHQKTNKSCIFGLFSSAKLYPCAQQLTVKETLHDSLPASDKSMSRLLGCLYPAIADNIINAARKDPAHRKLFVHGLAWEIAS
jgi:hypothetical protein